MITGILTINRDANKRLFYSVSFTDGGRIEGPPGDAVEPLISQANTFFARTPTRETDELNELIQNLTRLLPDNLIATIHEWCALGTSPVTLLVACADPELVLLPWELLPFALNLPQLFITRLALGTKTLLPSIPSSLRMLAVSSSHFYGKLPGIDREIAELMRIFSGAGGAVTFLSNPTYESFLERLQTVRPNLLHLALDGIMNAADDPAIAMTAAGNLEGAPNFHWVGTTVLCQALELIPSIDLIMLNTCQSGLNMARLICERLGIATVGWIGYVEDMVAADFTAYFYQRLATGYSVVDAVREFMWQLRSQGTTPPHSLPLVWLPSLESVEATLVPTKAESLENLQDVSEHVVEQEKQSDSLKTVQPDFYSHILISQGLFVSIEFAPEHTLNPALLLNKQPSIKRLNISSNRKVSGLRLQILCDTGEGTSSFQRTINLVEGPQPLPIDDICFPALYHLIYTKSGRRLINFAISISSKGQLIAEDTRTSTWMACNEWMDSKETWPYIPAFVNPHSEAIRGVINGEKGAIHQLHNLGTPHNNFVGYDQKNSEYVHLQMRAIFQTLRNLPINYINPPGSPVFLEKSYRPGGQVVRLPQEVLEHKAGTCHDLAVLLASCAEHIGIFPLIILVPDHTMMGYWTDYQAFQQFWKQTFDQRSVSFGRGWIIVSKDELGTLIQDKRIQLVEVTDMTEHGGTYARACLKWNSLEKIEARGFHIAVDICASRPWIQPIVID